MTLLKYWDAGQGAYVTFGGGPGVAYTQVGATAPPASNPVVAPPQGLLWLDTSTGAATTTPYYPPQTPPASGFNSFTDASGEVWVSLNGNAWKKARDVLYCAYYRNAAYTIPTGITTLIFDTPFTGGDVYGLYNTGNGTATLPIAGKWRVIATVSANTTAANQLVVMAYVNGASRQAAQGHSGATNAPLSVTLSVLLPLAAGSTIIAQTSIFTSVSLQVPALGSVYSHFSVEYAGTG